MRRDSFILYGATRPSVEALAPLPPFLATDTNDETDSIIVTAGIDYDCSRDTCYVRRHRAIAFVDRQAGSHGEEPLD